MQSCTVDESLAHTAGTAFPEALRAPCEGTVSMERPPVFLYGTAYLLLADKALRRYSCSRFSAVREERTFTVPLSMGAISAICDIGIPFLRHTL